VNKPELQWLSLFQYFKHCRAEFVFKYVKTIFQHPVPLNLFQDAYMSVKCHLQPSWVFADTHQLKLLTALLVWFGQHSMSDMLFNILLHIKYSLILGFVFVKWKIVGEAVEVTAFVVDVVQCWDRYRAYIHYWRLMKVHY
jgi:hypothetical protein